MTRPRNDLNCCHNAQMERTGTIRQVYRLLSRAERREFFCLMTASCLTGLFDLIGIYALSGSILFLGSSQVNSNFFVVFLESALPSYTNSSIFLILIAFTMILFIFKSLISIRLAYFVMSFLSRIGKKFSTKLSTEFFQLDLITIRKIQSQKIAQGLNYGINAMVMEFLGSYLILVGEIFLIVIIVGALILINPILASCLVVYFGVISFLLFVRIGRNSSISGNDRIEADTAGNSIILDLVNGYKEIFVLNRTSDVLKYYVEKRQKSLRASEKLALSGIIPKYVMELSLVFSIALLAVVGSFTSSDSANFYSTVVVFFAASSRLLPSLLRIQTAVNTIKSSERTSKFTWEITDLISTHFESTPVRGTYATPSLAIPIAEKSQLIVAENLKYSYPDSDFQIASVSFSVVLGEFVAFVGRSGSGKTTIVDLLTGVLQPTEGKLELEGLPPREFLKQNPGAIGFVPQNVELFNRTVAENVALFDDSIDYERVRDCLRKAEALEFCEKLDEGLNTLLGERGLNLSGGQRQRVGIARALYTNPRILILDEATSALDSESELAISRSVESISRKTTTIVVAHRLSTVQRSDRVFYWEDGKLRSVGKFQDIRRINPDFDNQANILGL
jgi:ABC-type multidrug transport system fused ATPase/permease subunit